jgi:hypothetical protein
MCVCVCVCVYIYIYIHIYSLIDRERLHQFVPESACLFLETNESFYKGQDSENILGSSLGEDYFWSSGSKHDKSNDAKTKVACFA